jgi:hypothetical protein
MGGRREGRRGSAAGSYKHVSPCREASSAAAPPASIVLIPLRSIPVYSGTPTLYQALTRGRTRLRGGGVTLPRKHAQCFACGLWAPPASIVLIPLRSIPVYSGTPASFVLIRRVYFKGGKGVPAKAARGALNLRPPRKGLEGARGRRGRT